MCSLGLHTRVKDKRNLIANLSHFYDEKLNVPYTQTDDKKKCEIFAINNSKTDFITGNKLNGIGDHYYPLCADLKKLSIIGSDSLWNRIPVSGSNLSYKKSGDYNHQLELWLEYAESRNAKMYYMLTDEHINIIKDLEQELVRINKEKFDLLCLI